MSSFAALLPRGAALLLVFLSTGCITFTWQRASWQTPPDDEAIASLGEEDGISTLEHCLDAFGAPLWVWEGGAGSEIGATIVYGWYRNRDTGGSVSVPVAEGFSASMRFNRIDQDTRGLLLVFDNDWQLLSWRQGRLRDLSLPPERTRPLRIEDIE